MGQLLSCCPAPDSLAVSSIHAEHIKAMNDGWLRVGDSWQRWRSFNFHPRFGYSFRGCLLAGRLCQKQKKFFIPNNGRGTAGTGQLHLPLNILSGTPLGGRLATGHGSIGIRPTPSRPLIGTPQTWAKANEADDKRYKYAHEHGESNSLDAGGQFFVRQQRCQSLMRCSLNRLSSLSSVDLLPLPRMRDITSLRLPLVKTSGMVISAFV